MGIERNAEWGSEQLLEDEPVRCRSDADVGAVEAGALVALSGGNIWETLGRPSVPRRGTKARVLGLDGLVVSMKTRSGAEIDVVAADSVVVRRPLRRGGPLVGEMVIVSSSGRLRRRDILPRAHPNDGMLDVLVASSLSARERIIAWSRARHGAHLPHPALSAARERTVRVAAREGTVVVHVDGRRFSCTECAVAVAQDRWRVALPVPTVGGP